MNMENMDVSGVDVKVEATADLTPAVKAGSDIATDAHKGVSKLFRALFGPWIEERVRKADLLAAQTVKDCADIKAGVVTYAENKLLRFEPQPTIASSFDMLHTLNHASDAKRLHAAMQEAARQISEVPEGQISDEPLSQDFFNHWRREAEMIDDEALRQWWARLLVAETKTPNSISPRTLDVAQKLSKDEARIFRVMLKGVVNGWVPIGENGHPQYVTYADALRMEDSGLITAAESSVPWDSYYSHEVATSDTMIVPIDQSDCVMCVKGKPIKISCYLMTIAGRQLARIIGGERTVQNMVEITKYLSAKHRANVFSLHIGKIVAHGRIFWKMDPEWVSENANLPQGVTK